MSARKSANNGFPTPLPAFVREKLEAFVRYDRCGARMQLRALVITSTAIDRILRWLGEPTCLRQRSMGRGSRCFR